MVSISILSLFYNVTKKNIIQHNSQQHNILINFTIIILQTLKKIQQINNSAKGQYQFMPRFSHLQDKHSHNNHYYNPIVNSRFNPFASNLNQSLVDTYNPVYFAQRAKQLNQINTNTGHQSKNYKNKNLNHPGYKKRPPHDVYQQDIECVYQGKNGIGKIFIGNLQAAQNLQTLKKYNIGAVLTACKGIYIDHPKTHIQHYLYIPGEDHERYDIQNHFQQAANFIKKTTQQTNILVHCMAGISRSVSLVLAYLMKQKGMKYNQAYSIIKKNRKIINPNPGFVRQLQKFQKQLQRQMCSRNRSIEQFQRFDINEGFQSRHEYSPQCSKRRYRNQNTNPESLYLKQQAKLQNKNLYKSQVAIKLESQKNTPLNSSSAYNSSKKYIKQEIPYRMNGYLFDRPTTNYQKNNFFNEKAADNYNYNKNECNDYRGYNQSIQSMAQISNSKTNLNKTVNFDNYKTKVSSYNDLNRQIDQKIKNIRQKYTQYTTQLAQNGGYSNNNLNLRQTMPVNKKQNTQVGSRAFFMPDRNSLYQYQLIKNNPNLYKAPLIGQRQREYEQNAAKKNRNYDDLQFDYPKRNNNNGLWATDRLKEMLYNKNTAGNENILNQKERQARLSYESRRY